MLHPHRKGGPDLCSTICNTLDTYLTLHLLHTDGFLVWLPVWRHPARQQHAHMGPATSAQQRAPGSARRLPAASRRLTPYYPTHSQFTLAFVTSPQGPPARVEDDAEHVAVQREPRC